MDRSRNRPWVVFDLGEVLNPTPTHFAELAELIGADEPELTAAYVLHRHSYDEGGPGSAYWRSVGEELGVDVDEALAARLTELDSFTRTSLHPDSLPLLLDVKAAGYGLALLSNLPADLAERARKQPWSEAFDLLVFSCDVGTMKPQPTIYRIVEEGIADLACAGDATEPPRTAPITFFDDRPENVEAAIAAGWRARVWAGHADARAFLPV